jgi:hypothetical protein
MFFLEHIYLRGTQRSTIALTRHWWRNEDTKQELHTANRDGEIVTNSDKERDCKHNETLGSTRTS